jgi:hypothetical protein
LGERLVDPGRLKQTQRGETVFIDVQLDARRLIFGPGVDRFGFRLLHGLDDVVVLDLGDGHEHGEDHHRSSNQPVQPLVVAFRIVRHDRPRFSDGSLAAIR